MNFFKQEIADGLVEIMSNQNTVAYLSPAISSFKSIYTNEKSVAELIKRSNLESATAEQALDLFYLTSILVSTGWNKNDDVFLPQEVWAARKTPEDKQFNYMHNEKDIIGHITGNYAVNFDGDILSDELDTPPNDFNIVTTAVLYKSWSDEDLQDRMKTIIAEIEAGGKWHVSMECLFPSFDYALQDSSGRTRVVGREEATAYLTKHLRAYGGTGEYDGYKVGRVLRNLSFSGKGLVTKPANPRSVILNKSVSENNEEKQMELEELKAKLAKAEAELAAASKLSEQTKAEKEQAVKEALAKIEEYKTSLAAKEESLASLQSQIDTLAKELTETKASLETIKGEKEAAEAKMKDMEKKAKYEKRKAQLAEAGLDNDDVEATLASVDSLDDEAFDKVVAVMKKKAQKSAEAKKDDMKEEKKEDSSAAETILDDVEKVEKGVASQINEGDTSKEDKEQLRAKASQWFGSCFATTPKNK